MKKQEAKKSLKWIILAVVLVVAAVGVALALTLFSGDGDTGTAEGTENAATQVTESLQETTPEADAGESGIKIYWNVDRDAYVDDSGMNLRMRVGDYYRLRFAVDGEQRDLFFENFALVEKADSMLFMGLEVDENNVVQRVLDVHEFSGGITAYEYYVKEVGETEIKINSVGSLKGLDWVLRITEDTEIYNVGGSGLLVGLPGTVQVGSCVYAVMDKAGYTTHIFVLPPFEEEPVYWNVERMYDTSAKVTTRTRDALGYFNFLFAVNGEQVELRTMDTKIADAVDSYAAKCMHLEFNEDGTIAEVSHARVSTGGNSAASWHHIVEMNTHENSFVAEKFSGSDKGSVVTVNWHNDVKVFDCSDRATVVGEPTTLRLYDQVHCLTNPYGQATVIFVVSRPVDSPLYYNLERKWDAAAKASTRVPAADGYYYFDFSVEEQRVTLRTKDEAVVKAIDSRAAKVVGLELDGDVILKAYAPSSVSGSNVTVFDYTKVTQIAESGEITTTRNDKTYIGKMTEDTKIYDVSALASPVGGKTTLRVGDTVYGLADMKGKITSIFVTSRQNVGPLYWNLDRSYDSATKTTKRTRGADGYYHIALSDGTVTRNFKTQDKALVNTLDSYVACGVVTSGNIITKVYKYDTIVGYTGGGYASWTVVSSTNGRSFTSSDSKGTYTGYAGGKIYDVSQGSKAAVTETTLRVGDKIHAVRDANKNIVVVFVVSRPIQAEIYYNLERMWDSETSTSTRVADADGYYVFKMAYNGEHVEVKTKNATIVNTIDGRAAKVLGLDVQNGIIRNAYAPSKVADTMTTTFDYTDVTKIAADGTITTTRNGNTYTGKPSSKCKVFNVASNATLVGEYSKVSVGDKIYGLAGKDGLVNYIFILTKTVETETKVANCSVCNEEVTWRAWDGAMTLGAGHWYLTNDVTVSKTANIGKDTTVCLDLCGFDINGNEELDRIFNIYGLFNLMDVKNEEGNYEGNIIANYNNPNGRSGSVFYVQNSADYGMGVFCMYGGNLTATGQTKNGGIGGIGNDFYMYDGTISGGTAAQNGGNLYMENNADAFFAMFGGTITGGTSGNGIGGVRGSNPITLGGTAKITGNDTDLYLLGTEIITISQEIPFAEGAYIGLTLENEIGDVAQQAKEGDEAYFHCTNADLVYKDGKIVVDVPEFGHEDHCICGGAGEVGGHTCQNVTWQPWSGTVVDGGHYVLTCDTDISASINIAKGTTVTLCLNGYNLTGNVRMLDVSGVLNLCDHTGSGSVSSTVVKLAPIFYVRDGGTFNLFGGNLIGSDQAQAAVGGLGDKADAAVSGTLNMYGGQIIGAKATNNGGAIELYHTSHANIYGGTIVGGEAVSGSAISMSGRATLNILGGTITGGTSAKGSINAAGHVTVGGNAKISGSNTNLYLPNGNTIAINGLTEDALIYVTLAGGTGEFATGAVETDAAYFRADNGSEVIYGSGKLAIGTTPEPEIPTEPTEPSEPEVHEDHCICGDLGEVGNHACESVAWEAWNGTLANGGFYYLEQDTSVTETIKIPAGSTVSLCLNGHKLSGNVRMLDISGVLNLCDHTGNGSVSSTVSNKMAPIFYVRDGGIFNFFGGKLQGANQSRSAVGSLGDNASAAVNGTMNMYGGQIIGAKVTDGGGCMELFHGSVFNLYGGTITAGEASKGSAITVNSKSSLNLLGGTITGGTSAKGSVYMDGTGSLVVGGNVQISGSNTNIYLCSGKTITIDGLDTGAELYVTMADGSGIFATNAGESDVTYFKADNGAKIVLDGDTLVMTDEIEGEPPQEGGHTDHCICGGLGAKGDHTTSTTVTWEPFAGTWENGKNYYLTEDLELTAQVNIPEGNVIHLCLNGHAIRGTSGLSRVLNMNGELTICDHKQSDGTYKGSVSSVYTGTAAKYGTLVYVQNKAGASFSLFGGNLSSTGNATEAGGAICTDRVVKIYDGTVTGGSCTKNGGTLAIMNANGDVRIYGGTISGGRANAGGSIYGAKGKLLIAGGTITGGQAVGSGGNLNIQGTMQVQITGGTISNGKSTSYNGGNIHITGGNVVLSGGTIYGGEVLNAATGGNGGNIYAVSGTFQMTGGTVYGGKAINGGNICVKIDGVAISGGTIYGGNATNGADIYLEKASGTMTLSGLINSLEQIIKVLVKQGTVDTTGLDPATLIEIVTG